MNIIIIGGGVIGLACAWRLAQAGARVQLLEARRCGQGATLAALGALWPASPLSTGPLQRLHRESLAEFETFAGALATASGRPVRFARLGRIEILDSGRAVANAREAAATCRELPPAQTLTYLDSGALAALLPGLRPAPFGALRCAFTAQVMVHDLVAALRAACENAGVTIREGTRATNLSEPSGGTVGVRIEGQHLAADHILIAGGAWSSLLPELAHLPIRPVKGQGLALRVPADHLPPTIVKAGTIYLIPWHDAGELLVGSTTEPDAGYDEAPTPAAREALLAGATAILPALRDAPVLRHWAGLRPQNPAKRHPPLMGRVPNRPNVWLCAGHFKTGIGMAPLVSRLMAESILTGKLSDPLAPFAP